MRGSQLVKGTHAAGLLSMCMANIPPRAPQGPEEPHLPREDEARPTPLQRSSKGESRGPADAKPACTNTPFVGEKQIPPKLDHCLLQKGCESGSGATSNLAPGAKSSEAGTEQGGTDLIFNLISKKGVQGVTGSVDTSGISDKSSGGESKAKSRQPGHSPGQEEEEEREASSPELD